jgi:WD40 repeat protein
LAVSPDERWLTVGTQFGVYQYHADTFERAWFTSLKEYASQVSYDPQGNRLGISSGSDIVLLDPETGKQMVRMEKAGWFSWSPDSQRLVSGNSCETVRVWNARDGAMLKELRGNHCSEGYSGISVTWGADNRIYAASMGTKILAWNASTYAPIETFSAKGAADTWIDALLAAPSGSLIAQHDSMGGPVVAIIDGQQDRQIHLLDQQVNGPISALAWAADGERLAGA